MPRESLLEEDILEVFLSSFAPMTVLELWDALQANEVEVPVIYLGKVVKNLEQARLLRIAGERQSNLCYKLTMSAFTFNRKSESFLLRFCDRPKSRLLFYRKPASLFSKWFLIGLCLLFFPLQAAAQQTIFNVPSADVTPKGKLFLQHESQFRGWKPGRFLSNTEYSAYGIGYNTELDATVFNINVPPSDNITLGIGFKAAIPLLKKQLSDEELKLTVGSMLPISLQGDGVGNWSYSHLSVRIPKVKTRLTGGVSVGTRQIFGRNAIAFIGGVEQPVIKRVNIIADWYSGTHNLGLFITGVSVAFPEDTHLYVGYQIQNTDRSGSQGLVVELSKLLF